MEGFYPHTSNYSPYPKVRPISLGVSTIPFENEDCDEHGGEDAHWLKNQKNWPKDTVQTEGHRKWKGWS